MTKAPITLQKNAEIIRFCRANAGCRIYRNPDRVAYNDSALDVERLDELIRPVSQ